MKTESTATFDVGRVFPPRGRLWQNVRHFLQPLGLTVVRERRSVRPHIRDGHTLCCTVNVPPLNRTVLGLLTMSVERKRALVTGSSRGIGRAIALALAHDGADVAVNYVSDRQAAEAVVRLIEHEGRESFAIQADISNDDDLEQLFRRVNAAWGSLDIFVNNAIDVAAWGCLTRIQVSRWRHTVDSHVTSYFVAAKLAAQLMTGRRGSIVAISSTGAHSCVPDYGAVGVGKAAIEALTRYLAVELGPSGIRVNAVCAGPIDTDTLRRLEQFALLVDLSKRVLPAGRMGQPDDVAQVVAFLCSESARWIYGQTLFADGGLSLLSGQLSISAALAGVSDGIIERRHT